MRPSFQGQIRELAAEVVRSTLQKVGAHAVDRAIWHLGIGRQGIRLTGSSLGPETDRWEAEVSGWKPSIVAEAAELIAYRALSAVFDLDGGESIALESMNIRWLQSGAVRIQKSGTVFLEWSLAEREEFRRETLANLTSGALAYLTVIGCDEEGLGIVQIELEVRASTRRQLAGAKS